MRGKKYGCTLQTYRPLEPVANDGDIISYKVIATFQGIAHVVEEEYDDYFRPWFGSIEFTCTQDEFRDNIMLHPSDGFMLSLDDGRGGGIRLMSAEGSYTSDNVIGDDHQMMRFIGLTSSLEKPSEARRLQVA